MPNENLHGSVMAEKVAEKRAPSQPKGEFNINNIDLDNIISHIKDTNDHRSSSNSVPKSNSNSNLNQDTFNIIDFTSNPKPNDKSQKQEANNEVKNDLFGIWESVPNMTQNTPNPGNFNSGGSNSNHSSTSKANASGI
jgi:hypothetical protein